MKRFVKSSGFSSDGTSIFVTSDDEYFAINSDKCRKISGIDDYLSSYLSNTLRVFTPCEMRIYKKTIEVNFTLEKVSFVAERIPVPEWIKDGKEIKELTEESK